MENLRYNEFKNALIKILSSNGYNEAENIAAEIASKFYDLVDKHNL